MFIKTLQPSRTKFSTSVQNPFKTNVKHALQSILDTSLQNRKKANSNFALSHLHSVVNYKQVIITSLPNMTKQKKEKRKKKKQDTTVRPELEF